MAQEKLIGCSRNKALIKWEDMNENKQFRIKRYEEKMEGYCDFGENFWDSFICRKKNYQDNYKYQYNNN